METSGSASAAAHDTPAQDVPRNTIGWMEARPSSGLHFFSIYFLLHECFSFICENLIRHTRNLNISGKNIIGLDHHVWGSDGTSTVLVEGLKLLPIKVKLQIF